MAGNIHFRFIPTKRGGETLVIDGYMLRVSKHIATKKHWKCEVGDCKVGYAPFRLIQFRRIPFCGRWFFLSAKWDSAKREDTH